MNSFRKILYIFCTTCRPNTSATVRYAFPIMFAVATILSASVIVSTNKSFIHLETSDTSVKAGETFEIEVFVTAHVPVNAVDITLNFPKDQISIIGIDKGESVITLWAQEPVVKNNTVVLQGGTFRKGFIGDHKIATINARAIATGIAQFSAEDVIFLAGDGTGSKVTVTKTGEEKASLYVTKEDGTIVDSEDGVGLQGTASIVIITDIDGDGEVTLADISRFMSGWSTKTIVYDFNGDGKMTFRDFAIILADSFLR